MWKNLTPYGCGMKLPVKKMRLGVIILLVMTITTNAAEPLDWKRRFSAFGTGVPEAQFEPGVSELFSTELKDFELSAKSFEEAFDSIRSALDKNGGKYGLSLILHSPDNAAYQKPVIIKKKTITLGEAIDQLCVECGLIWDFGSVKLTIRPKSPAN